MREDATTAAISLRRGGFIVQDFSKSIDITVRLYIAAQQQNASCVSDVYREPIFVEAFLVTLWTAFTMTPSVSFSFAFV